MDEAERLHFEHVAQWRDWLATHHTQRAGIWLVQWKPRTGKPAIPYEEAIEEALCWGWIDSTYRSLDAERGTLWWSPRRKGSLWSASNKARVTRLEAAGRITPAGRAAIDAAQADGSWWTLEPVEALIVPDDLAGALAARPTAADRWAALSPTVRRSFLLWIGTARTPATRARRVQESADRVAEGRRLGGG
jgi:uncharacterized protein YdeI (YjbR/CyaY-like superfamily)